MNKGRNPITRERRRTTELISEARRYDLQCYVWLHIVDNKSHENILDDLSEDFMKAYQRVDFQTVEIPEERLCIRSERSRCIMPEKTAITDDELSEASWLAPLTYAGSPESQVWHFAGGVWLTNMETSFCEYDANTGKGGMIIFFNGRDIPDLLEGYPQLKPKIKIAKPDQLNCLLANW